MSETPNQDDCRGTLVRGSDGVLSCPECGWRFEPGSPKSRMRKPTAIDAKDAEIASLRAQLESEREAAAGLISAAKYGARRKAIEDAANTAEQHSRLDIRCKCGFEIAEDIRALLSESKS